MAVARRTDNVVIAQRVHVPSRTDDYLANVKRVLSSPGWANVTTDKLSLDDGDNTFYVLIDEAGRAYIAVASKSYPARHIYDSPDGRNQGFLGAVQRGFLSNYGDSTLTCGPDGYTSRAKSMLKELCDRYNNLRDIDKISKVQAQVADVTGIMQENIKLVMERGDRVDQLEERTQALNEQAGRFEKSSTTLKKTMRCRSWKLTAAITAVVLVVLAIIIIIIVEENKKD